MVNRKGLQLLRGSKTNFKGKKEPRPQSNLKKYSPDTVFAGNVYLI